MKYFISLLLRGLEPLFQAALAVSGVAASSGTAPFPFPSQALAVFVPPAGGLGVCGTALRHSAGGTIRAGLNHLTRSGSVAAAARNSTPSPPSALQPPFPGEHDLSHNAAALLRAWLPLRSCCGYRGEQPGSGSRRDCSCL